MKIAKIIKKINSEKYDYIKTDIESFDQEWNGLRIGDLSVFAERPAMGATSLFCSFAKNISKRNIPVLFITNDKRDTIQRMISLEIGHFIKAPPYPLIDLPIDIEDMFIFDLKRLKNIIQNTLAKVIFIDLFILGNINEEKIKYLKNIANEKKIAILLLAYLPPEIDNRKNKHPKISDLSDRSYQRGIIKNVDLIFLLYRENYYKFLENKPKSEINELEIFEAKHILGFYSYFKITKNLEVVSFYD